MLALVLFFLITDFYFWIAVVIAQVFNTTAELVVSIGITTKEGKSEIETYLVTT